MAGLGLLPPVKEQGDFRVPTDQRGESSWLRDIQATRRPTRTEYMIDAHGLSHPSQRLGSQILAGKITLHQAMRRGTDHHRIGRSQALDSGGDIGSLAEGQLLVSATTAYLTDNDQARMNAQTEGKLHPVGLLQMGLEI